jgi:hypothetical protein
MSRTLSITLSTTSSQAISRPQSIETQNSKIKNALDPIRLIGLIGPIPLISPDFWAP